MPDAPPSTPLEPFRPLPDPTWRERAEAIVERLRALGPVSRFVVGGASVVGAIVLVIVVLRPATPESAPDDYLPRASSAPSAAVASTSSSSLVVVQAAGAVTRPGLYRLAPGARVADLVDAAGGLTLDADADRVNLAALLADGQKVYIPRQGEIVPAEVAEDPGGSSSSSGQPIDLNTASIAQLDTLPGIGPTTAQAIVDYRTQHGRFRSVDDLLNVRGIGPAKLEEIRALVRV